MIVYIGYTCYYDYCNIFKEVWKVFADEVEALVWKDEFKSTAFEWREYQEWVVE
jgi:hypothetical protein